MIAQTLADRIVWCIAAAIFLAFAAAVSAAGYVWLRDPRSPGHWIIDALGACEEHPS